MPRPHLVDQWGLGARVAELWAQGLRGRAIAKEIMPAVQAWCEKHGKPVPSQDAVAMAVQRYMATDPVDRRLRKAKAQEKAKELVVRQAGEILGAQVDALRMIHEKLRWVEAEAAKLEQAKEKVTLPNGEEVVVLPGVRDYYLALKAASSELRGWLELLVDIKDKLWLHEQYERAFTAIIEAVRAECPADVLQRIVARLQADPAVAAAVRGMGGGA